MAHRLEGWTAIRYAEKHGGTLKKFSDPTERALKRVSIKKAQRVAHEDARLIYMDVPHANNPARVARGKAVTLRNMASVTIRRLPGGAVAVTGRKLGGARRANPRRQRKSAKR
jgi:hypothetical protein